MTDPDACWSCRGPVPAAEPFCPTCKAVQPPGQADHFRRLGFARTFDLDRKLVERRYFELQRTLHPDRFAARSPKERALSQAQATSLNEAYEALMDPLKRASYLLKLSGIETGSDGKTVTDPALLMDAMEMREALAEARKPAEVDAVVAGARRDAEAAEAQLSRDFAAEDLEAAKTTTLRLTYLDKLIDDARARRLNVA
ncbi:MAG: Fe-S protein assembly co-chaperone HscB [Alphaproteobacteria bacterium]|nr:Fe-S protein assembly co-chaperone HscB [Alphaproteobacteria bacterium]